MTTLSVNRPVVEDIRETTSISPTTATTTVIPTRSCDHFNCFWLGKFPRLPRRLCASANGNRCSAAHARDLQPAAMRCGADALVRVGGSVGLLWRGRPRPRWRRPDAPHLRAFSQMWVSVLRRWKRGPLGPRINSIYDLASAAVG